MNWSSTKQLLSFNGQLISAGHYTSINGKNIASIASWNGSTWSGLGNGLNGGVWDIAEHSGQLYATGDFTSSGSDTTVKHIAKWDGIKWSPLNPNNSFERAGPLVSFNNSLIIGNVWDTIAGIPMKGIAVWNGTTFVSRGNNLIHNVNKFWLFNNELYLCGDIYTLNPNQFAYVVLKWNGFFWQQIGINFNQPIWAIDDFNNQLFCGGFFSTPTSHVAKLISASGISDFNIQSDFQFYPNPANEQITFASSDKGTLTIANQLGEVVYSAFLKPYLNNMESNKMQEGVYFVTFQTEKHKTIRKLIIKR